MSKRPPTNGRPHRRLIGVANVRKVFAFFRRDEGLTTVEWVVRCAVVLLAAVGISNMVLQGADELGGAVADKMSDAADQVN
jgi:hypothetical protein